MQHRCACAPGRQRGGQLRGEQSRESREGGVAWGQHGGGDSRGRAAAGVECAVLFAQCGWLPGGHCTLASVEVPHDCRRSIRLESFSSCCCASWYARRRLACDSWRRRFFSVSSLRRSSSISARVDAGMRFATWAALDEGASNEGEPATRAGDGFAVAERGGATTNPSYPSSAVPPSLNRSESGTYTTVRPPPPRFLLLRGFGGGISAAASVAPRISAGEEQASDMSRPSNSEDTAEPGVEASPGVEGGRSRGANASRRGRENACGVRDVR